MQGQKDIEFHKKYLILCSEEGLMHLEWYKDECLMTEFSSYDKFSLGIFFTWYFKKSYIYLYKTHRNTVS